MPVASHNATEDPNSAEVMSVVAAKDIVDRILSVNCDDAVVACATVEGTVKLVAVQEGTEAIATGLTTDCVEPIAKKKTKFRTGLPSTQSLTLRRVLSAL